MNCSIWPYITVTVCHNKLLLLLLLLLLQYCREENALADELSNLAMDSDAAVDKVVQH
jgi:hypothetical protein